MVNGGVVDRAEAAQARGGAAVRVLGQDILHALVVAFKVFESVNFLEDLASVYVLNVAL